MVVQILLVLLGAIVAGVALLAWGWRGRRLNDHPICRDCGFDVKDTYPASITCPECGAGLKRAKGVRIGARRKRPVVLLVGLMLVLAPASLVVATVAAVLSGRDVVRYMPVGVLVYQGRHAGADGANAAAKELLRRQQAGEMTSAQLETVARAALDIQEEVSRPWSVEWGDLIDAALTSGVLGDDDQHRFSENMVVLDVKTRARVRPGDRVPIVVGLKESRVSAATQTNVMIMYGRSMLDGEEIRRVQPPREMRSTWWSQEASPLQPQIGWFYLYGASMGWGGGSRGGGIAMVRIPEDAKPGSHELEVEVRLGDIDTNGTVQIMTGLLSAQAGKMHSSSVPIEVVAKETQLVHRLESTAELAEQADALVMVSDGYVQSSGSGLGFGRNRQWLLSLSITIDEDCPPLAHKIVVTQGDEEWPVGYVTSEPSPQDQMYFPSNTLQHRQLFAQTDGLDPRRPIGLRLVPDPDLVLCTTGQDEYYGGELNLAIDTLVVRDQNGNVIEDDPE